MSKSQSGRESPRRSPVNFVTVKCDGGFQQPLAFVPHQMQGTIDTSSTLKLGVKIDFCKGLSHPWMVFVHRPLASYEFVEGLRAFQLAVLANERVSYMLGHQHGVDTDFVHNKYRYMLHPWNEAMSV